jgi:hypothetical protein
MRSIKKMLLLALTAIAAVAFTVPAIASAAEWTHEGSPLPGGARWLDEGEPLEAEGLSTTFKGPLKFSNVTLGGVECTLEANLSLDPALIDSLSISPASCKLSGVGTVKTQCESVTSVSFNFPFWAAYPETVKDVRKLLIQVGSMTYKFQPKEGSKNCPSEIEVTGAQGGGVVASPDKVNAVSSFTLSGQVGTKVNLNGNITNGGSWNTTGTPSITPAAKYGIGFADMVALSGNLQYSSITLGGAQCNVNGWLGLQPSNKGEISALSLSGCKATGAKEVSCGSAVTGVTKDLPWPVALEGNAFEGYEIKITKFPFELQFGKGCGPWQIDGTMIAEPNNPISSMALDSVLMAKIPSEVPQHWTGTWNWTPAGSYGIK